MNRRRKNPGHIARGLMGFVLALAIGGILFSTHGAMTDSLTPVSSLAGLNADDSVVWSQLGPNATLLASSLSTKSAHGVTITGTLTNSDSLVSVVCPATVCSWSSNDVAGFSAGDSVIWTSDNGNGGTGPLTLAFNKSVAGVGAFIQADAPGQFTAQVQAFNGAASLGSFTATSDSNGDAVFLGVLDSTAANITSVIFSLTASSGPLSDFAIDKLSINTAGGPTPTPTGTAAEPTTTATATPLLPTVTATATATATALAATPTPTATPSLGQTTSILGVPPQIKFGNVNAGGSGAPRKVSITNKGAFNAIIESTDVPPGFSVIPGSDQCLGHAVPPRKSCTMLLQFSPATPGGLAGALTVFYNGAAPALVGLSGNGTAVSLRAPLSVSLPPAVAGSTGAAKSITITNPSTTTVLVSPPSISQSFTIVSNGCASGSIKPKGKCVIDVAFVAPQNLGAGSTMGGTLGLDFTYGANSGSLPTISLVGRVK